MKYMAHLALAAVLVTSFLATEDAFAVNNHCTTTTPCDYQVCGDHICSQGEFADYRAAMLHAQRGNVTAGGNMTGGNMTTTQPAGTIYTGTMSFEDVASDGTIVILSTNHPMQGQPSIFGLGFFKSNGSPIQNQNYAITITQKNSTVFSDSRGTTSSGINSITTIPMPSSNEPLGIQVTLRGVGPSTADPSTWTGVKGETLTFGQGAITEASAMATNTTVTTTGSASSPEFGPVAPIVFTIAILSVIVFAAKTRTTTKP